MGNEPRDEDKGMRFQGYSHQDLACDHWNKEVENHRLLRRTLSQMLTAERILRTGSWSQWSRNQPTFVLLTYHTFGLTARSLLFLFIFAFFSASRKWKENYLQALENRLLLAWRYLSKDESNQRSISPEERKERRTQGCTLCCLVWM